MELLNFSGKISSTTPDRRSAIVKLFPPVSGMLYAVISPSTEGRIRAMNGVGGLKKDTMVSGSAKIGIDALDVVTITKMDP